MLSRRERDRPIGVTPRREDGCQRAEEESNVVPGGWHRSALLREISEIGFEQLHPFFLGGGFAIKGNRGDVGRSDAARPVSDLHFLGPTHAGEVAVVMGKTFKLGPIEVSFGELRISCPCPPKADSNKIGSEKVTFYNLAMTKIGELENRVRGVDSLQITPSK